MSVNSVAKLSAGESKQRAQELLQEAKNGNTDAIESICTGIYDSTAGRLGTNKAFIESIMDGADSETLAIIMDTYSEVTDSEIYKDLDNELLYGNKSEIKDKLESAYLESKGENYTGDNDGKLSIGQTLGGVFKGLKNKALGIVGVVGGTIALPFVGNLVASALTSQVGTLGAAAISIVGAPALILAGVITAGFMVYKGIKNISESYNNAKNSTTDNQTIDSVQQATEGVIDIAEGACVASLPAKGINTISNKVQTIKKSIDPIISVVSFVGRVKNKISSFV